MTSGKRNSELYEQERSALFDKPLEWRRACIEIIKFITYLCYSNQLIESPLKFPELLNWIKGKEIFAEKIIQEIIF